MAGDGVELATAYVSLVVAGDRVAPGVRKALGSADREADVAGKSSGKRYGSGFASSSLGALKGVGAGIGVALSTQAVIGFLKDANAEAREAQKVGAQTGAVIKSTGKAANLSAAQFGKLATSISKYAGIDDEAIQQGENLLATFTNVKNLGNGRDIFSKATRLAVDMGVALGTDTKSAALQLGKALNDPAKGFSRLQRSGVSFTDSQIEQIKNFQKTGQLAKAQGVILSEVAREFGGSAKAQATDSDKAAVAVGNLKEQIGTALLPTVDGFSRFVTNDATPAVSKFVTQMQDGTGVGGDFAQSLKGVGTTVKGIKDAFGLIPSGVIEDVRKLASFNLANTIGGFTHLADARKKANQQFRESLYGPEIKKLGNYKDAVDEATLAITKQGRAMAARDLYANGSLQAAQKLGLNTQDLISATTGSEKAAKRLQTQLGKLADPNLAGGLTAALGKTSDYAQIKKVMDAIGAKIEDTRDKIRKSQNAALDYQLSLVALPTDVETAITAVGANASATDVARLRDQYNLTPKQVSTLVSTLGKTGAIKDVQGFREAVAKVPRSKTSRLAADTKQGRTDAGAFNTYLTGLFSKNHPVNVKTNSKSNRDDASSFKTYLNGLFGRGITQHVTVDRSAGGLLPPAGGGGKSGSRIAASSERSSGAVFPSQVTLVDRDGSLLGHMDVRAENVTYGILQTEGVV